MISEQLARCLARISGDGYLSLKYIRYSNTCTILREEFKNDMLHEFGPLHFNEGMSNSGTPFVQIQRKHIISEFLLHLSDFRSSAIYIPLSVERSSLKIKSSYLQALYDDEGCVALRLSRAKGEWKRNITLTSNSFKLLQQVKQVLLEFAIQSNEIIRNSLQSRDRSYVLAITGKINISTFKEEIGFKHPWKIKMLDFMMSSYDSTSRHKEAFQLLQRELEQMREKKWTAMLRSRAQAQYR